MITIKFGPSTTDEVCVMVEASSESGDKTAQSILNKFDGKRFKNLTMDEAVYLRDNMFGDADRVSQGCGEATGRAFERGAEKLSELIESSKKFNALW